MNIVWVIEIFLRTSLHICLKGTKNRMSLIRVHWV